jgi:stearoyl-CoA desaturase (Delta-9 desaturase)
MTAAALPKSSLYSPATFAFLAMHLACFAAIFTGVHFSDLILCAVLYVVRMFGVTAGYHRYFSHRSFKLGRVAQFALAFLAQTSSQKGVVWWAAHHRHHHKHSDCENDVHSPSQHGLWWAHMGWVLSDKWEATNEGNVRDWVRYPELMWLNRHWYVPPVVLGVATLLIFGWSGLVVGFVWSSVLLWHGTFTINSLSHVFGSRRYETRDDSRNNGLLAMITLGEGWHNNHHHYPAAACQGFYWWEVDITWYGLKALSWIGIVRDLKRPPAHILENRAPLPAAEAAE